MSQRDKGFDYTPRDTLLWMRGWVFRLGLMGIGGLGVLPMACTSSSSVFTCSSDVDCTGEGVGSCQSNGFCAFPDAMCPSGSRYGALAGGGFADTCVPQDGETETDTFAGSTGSTTTEPTATTNLTTNLTSAETTRGESSTETSDLAESSTTGGPALCEVLFVDEFEEKELWPGWEMIGTGQVTLSGDTVDLMPTPQAGDQPTWIRRTTPVRFEGGWFRVWLDDVPGDDGLQAIISLSHQNEVDSFDIVVDESAGQIYARAWDADGFTDLQAVKFNSFFTPWIGLREADGQIIFERGEDANELVPFYAVDADVTEWDATLYIGADNFIDLLASDEIRIEEAAACVLP